MEVLATLGSCFSRAKVGQSCPMGCEHFSLPVPAQLGFHWSFSPLASGSFAVGGGVKCDAFNLRWRACLEESQIGVYFFPHSCYSPWPSWMQVLISAVPSPEYLSCQCSLWLWLHSILFLLKPFLESTFYLFIFESYSAFLFIPFSLKCSLMFLSYLFFWLILYLSTTFPPQLSFFPPLFTFFRWQLIIMCLFPYHERHFRQNSSHDCYKTCKCGYIRYFVLWFLHYGLRMEHRTCSFLY